MGTPRSCIVYFTICECVCVCEGACVCVCVCVVSLGKKHDGGRRRKESNSRVGMAFVRIPWAATQCLALRRRHTATTHALMSCDMHYATVFRPVIREVPISFIV